MSESLIARCYIAWPGGEAKFGETVNPKKVPEVTLQRWTSAKVLVPEKEFDGSEYDPMADPRGEGSDQ